MSVSRELVVGVTGHRFLADVDRVSAGVDEALTHIQDAFPARTLNIMSSLAEGADRLVATRALARPGVTLEAVLPLPPDEYVRDFATEDSRQEFSALLEQAARIVSMPPAPSRAAAYDAAGRFILDRCEALIAVWDGKEAQGQGGTGAIVAEARRRGLPLAWIHAGNRAPGTTNATTLGKEQGRVTYEAFPPLPAGHTD